MDDRAEAWLDGEHGAGAANGGNLGFSEPVVVILPRKTNRALTGMSPSNSLPPDEENSEGADEF
jgi:hypothetical protein